ncbi:MAG: hypothetical protein IT367_14755 [Candidatus Hydrogenedentes bacterium]|nr:hypothetical protein [Candidatus Hydrogenedentota bacterium]
MACWVFSGCGDVRVFDVPIGKNVEPPDSLSIFYTCDTRGHINPCNCTAGVAGGLARRKTFISQLQQGDSLIVDVGNNTAGVRDWELLELEYILRGYDAIGYDAVNIGAREAGLPATKLKALATRYPFLVSANIQDASGASIFPAYQVVTMKSGYRAAVIGVVDDTLLPDEIGEGVKIVPPEQAIAAVLPKAKAEADIVTLLAFADEQAMKSLADQFYEIAVMIGGDVEQPSGEPVTANKSTLVYVTDKGKSVGKLDLRYVGGQYVAEKNVITMLMENIADDAKIAALVNELYQKQVENNYPTKKDDEDGLTRVN